jgi:hypothetical protein
MPTSHSDMGLDEIAAAVGVLRPAHPRPPRYEPPINSCAVCGTPTSGVLCLSCATK